MRLELIRCRMNDELDRIDLLVSFVMRSGLDLIAPRRDEALARGARLRLLTTDYLYVTDDAALGSSWTTPEITPVVAGSKPCVLRSVNELPPESAFILVLQRRTRERR
jgi:hypothetical protein